MSIAPTARPACLAWLVPVGLAALVLPLYAWLGARDDILGSLSDGAVYLALADALSPWRDGRFVPAAVLFGDYAFPPLYPGVLALAGGGGAALRWSYFVDAVLLAAAVVAVHAWARPLLDSSARAAATAFLFALLPVSLLGAMTIQSESLFVLLLYADLTAARHGRGQAGAALLGLAVLARSAGVAALAAAACRRDTWRPVPLVLLGLPWLLWLAWRWHNAAESSYASELAGVTAVRVGEVLAANLAQLPRGWWRSFDPGLAPHTGIALAALAVMAVLGWLPRLRRLRLDALFLLAYLAMILLWPHPAHMRRFLYALLPLGLVYAQLACGPLGRRWPRLAVVRALPGIVIALFAVTAAPSVADILHQVAAADSAPRASYVRTAQWYEYTDAARAQAELDGVAAIFESMRGIDEHLPPGACVSSVAAPYIVLVGRRRALPVPPSWSDDAHFEAALARCPYVFMMAASQWPRAGYPPLYPHARIAGRIEVIEVKLHDPTRAQGAVLTMLARYRGGTAAP